MRFIAVFLILGCILFLTACLGSGAERVNGELQKQAVISEAVVDDRRTFENVSAVFSKNNGAIYALYNKALKKNPTLEGKVVFQFEINPGGKVSKCTVLSQGTTLNDGAFLKKVAARISLFEFGKVSHSKNLVVKFPIDFVAP